MHRRSFLRALLDAALALTVGRWATACGKSEDDRNRSSVRSGPAPAATPAAPRSPFDAEQDRALVAAVERLIPSGTPTSPGAREANVAQYIRRAMSDRFFDRTRPPFARGLSYLDAIARREHRKVFAELAPGEQDAILGRFQRGEVPGLRFAQREFFEVLRVLSLEGFLGAPVHAGNKDRIAWTWLGIELGCVDSLCG